MDGSNGGQDEQLRRDLEHKDREYQDKEKDFRHQETQIRDEEQKLHHREEELHKLDEEHRKLDEEAKKAHHDIDEAKKKYDTLFYQVKVSADKVRDMGSEISRERAKHQEAQRNLEHVRGEKDALKREVDQLRSKVHH